VGGVSAVLGGVSVLATYFNSIAPKGFVEQ